MRISFSFQPTLYRAEADCPDCAIAFGHVLYTMGHITVYNVEHATMLVALDRTKATLKQTLGDGVARRLREEIISGNLLPGAMLAEIPTAERLGVSRVPVREALLVLERDGLLVFDERGRCRVRTLTARRF